MNPSRLVHTGRPRHQHRHLWDNDRVSPQPADAGFERERARIRREVCKAFQVKPWQVGIGPVPWWWPWWRRVRFPYDLLMARRRGIRWTDGRWVDR